MKLMIWICCFLYFSCASFIHFFGVLLFLSSVGVFKEIANELGAVHWSFDADLCELEVGGISQTPPPNSDGYVECNCNFNNNTVCHVTALYGFRFLTFYYNSPGIGLYCNEFIHVFLLMQCD